MKALGRRIEQLYETQAQRWRTAWEQFERPLWRDLSDHELRLLIAFYELNEQERGVRTGGASIVRPDERRNDT